MKMFFFKPGANFWKSLIVLSLIFGAIHFFGRKTDFIAHLSEEEWLQRKWAFERSRGKK